MNLKDMIRSIPDYPKPGIVFRDITTLFGSPRALRQCIGDLCAPYVDVGIDKVAGIEARGFILGGAVADRLGAGFVPIRKRGKLPFETVSVAYSLEYGVDEMEIHRDAVFEGEKVVLCDDLIATGGTACAAVELLRRLGAEVVAAIFVIDLPELGGADRLRAMNLPVKTLVEFEGH